MPIRMTLDGPPLVGLIQLLAYLVPSRVLKIASSVEIINVAAHEPDGAKLVKGVPRVLHWLGPYPQTGIRHDAFGTKLRESLVEICPKTTWSRRAAIEILEHSHQLIVIDAQGLA